MSFLSFVYFISTAGESGTNYSCAYNNNDDDDNNNNNKNKIHGLWNTEVQCRIHKGSPIISDLSRFNPIPLIDTHFFTVHPNIFLVSSIFPVGLPVTILKATLSSSVLATCPAHLIRLDLITLTIN